MPFLDKIPLTWKLKWREVVTMKAAYGSYKEENLEIPSIYYSHERQVIERDGVLWPFSEFIYKDPEEVLVNRQVRFRTVGDMSCTAALPSDADTIDKIIEEILTTTVSERGTRLDDKRAEAAMEMRKVNGYF